jgi:hypothetical protein
LRWLHFQIIVQRLSLFPSPTFPPDLPSFYEHPSLLPRSPKLTM